MSYDSNSEDDFFDQGSRKRKSQISDKLLSTYLNNQKSSMKPQKIGPGGVLPKGKDSDSWNSDDRYDEENNMREKKGAVGEPPQVPGKKKRGRPKMVRGSSENMGKIMPKPIK